MPSRLARAICSVILSGWSGLVYFSRSYIIIVSDQLKITTSGQFWQHDIIHIKDFFGVNFSMDSKSSLLHDPVLLPHAQFYS